MSLAAIADAYIAPMTSIRGRRVRRLLLREFARFDQVFPVETAAGLPALLAVGSEGFALCQTNGRGKLACIARWAAPDAARITTGYDLLHDSLPALSRSTGAADFRATAASLRLPAAALHALPAALPHLS